MSEQDRKTIAELSKHSPRMAALLYRRRKQDQEQQQESAMPSPPTFLERMFGDDPTLRPGLIVFALLIIASGVWGFVSAFINLD